VRPRTLRTRLVAATLLLLLVASVIITVATTLALRQFLVSQLDDDLRTNSQFLLAIQQGPGPADLPPPGPPKVLIDDRRGPPREDEVTAKIANGRVTEAGWTDGEGDQNPFPSAELPDLIALPPNGRPASVDLGPLGVFRMRAVTAPTGEILVNGLSERRLQGTVNWMITIEAIVGGATLVLAGVGGVFWVRRELRPLERVAATASRVSTLQLDRGEVDLAERVPDADPHTEVGQVGTALNRMLDHVGSALAARQDSETRLRQFLADASHELRTPLAAIRGYAELTRRAPLPDDAEHSLVRISSQAERMTTLVEDMLLLARLDAGRPLEQGEVDLTQLIVDAVSDAHATGPEHHWQLELPEEPVSVPGDASRLAQVLTNLLANARTHTPPATTVTVTLTTDHDTARMTVTDNGPGIAADLLPHVFERFARGSSSRSRTNGSTGLGLAIVQAVVTAHHGHVTVTTHPGHTSFVVDLPA
jgi:two-component system OmpR family sensor kinase